MNFTMELNTMPKHFLVFAVLASSVALSISAAPPATAANVLDTCAGCHGANGMSNDKDLPVIAGASSAYIGGTLQEYQSGRRTNCPEFTVLSGDKKGTKTDMCHVAKALSPTDIKAAADHYSGKPFVRAQQATDAGLAAKGKLIHNEVCEKCHTDGGSEADDDAGILAGQRVAYLKAQLDAYRAGKRTIPEKMVPKIQKLSPADVDALVQFYGSEK